MSKITHHEREAIKRRIAELNALFLANPPPESLTIQDWIKLVEERRLLEKSLLRHFGLAESA